MRGFAVSISAARQQKLRVLQVIPGHGEGASMIFARRQVQSLEQRGIEVRTFYLRDRVRPRRVWREWRRLAAEIRSYAPDLVHAHYGSMTSFLCATATRLPLVITYRGSDLHRGDATLPRSCLSRLLSQLCVLRAKRAICVSASVRERLWWRKDLAMVIPTGVNLEIFRPMPKEQARRLLGWDVDQRVVLFNEGGRPRIKGLDLLTRAVELAQRSIGPIRLVRLNGNVPPSEVPLYVNAADCVALASKYEGSPNIVKEALACNVPVVAVDVGDVTERLTGVTACKIVRRDAREFAAAIVEVMQSSEPCDGRLRVSNCSEDRVARAIISVYRQVVRGSGASSSHPLLFARQDFLQPDDRLQQ